MIDPSSCYDSDDSESDKDDTDLEVDLTCA